MGIYLQHNGQQVGPFSAAEVKSQLASGALSATDPVWWQGQADWVPLGVSTLARSGYKEPFGPQKKAEDLPSGLSPFALGSFLLAFISLIGGPVASIPGVVLGHLSLREIKKNPKRTGRGLAIAGLILCYIMTVVTTTIIVSMFVFSDQVQEASAREQALASQPPPLSPPAALQPAPHPAPAPPPAPVATPAPAAAPSPSPTLTNAAPVPAPPKETPNADTGPVKQ